MPDDQYQYDCHQLPVSCMYVLVLISQSGQCDVRGRWWPGEAGAIVPIIVDYCYYCIDYYCLPGDVIICLIRSDRIIIIVILSVINLISYH